MKARAVKDLLGRESFCIFTIACSQLVFFSLLKERGKNDHQIDFKNARVIDKGDYRVQKTLESWHTAMTTEVDNNAKSLPPQYSILLK